MTERYCVPTSAPCLFSVVGSWVVIKTSNRSRKEIISGSKLICITSACPVRPEHISLYVGLPGALPPEYPETTLSTPLISDKTASVHQKHPPPTVANSNFLLSINNLLFNYHRLRVDTIAKTTGFRAIR